MKIYTDEELAQLLDKDIFHTISEVADQLGVDCYVVGGYVRDIFLQLRCRYFFPYQKIYAMVHKEIMQYAP